MTRRRWEPVPVLLFLGVLGTLLLLPLAWGSTWMLHHGRGVGIVVALVFFGGWSLRHDRRRPR